MTTKAVPNFQALLSTLKSFRNIRAITTSAIAQFPEILPLKSQAGEATITALPLQDFVANILALMMLHI